VHTVLGVATRVTWQKFNVTAQFLWNRLVKPHPHHTVWGTVTLATALSMVVIAVTPSAYTNNSLNKAPLTEVVKWADDVQVFAQILERNS